MQQYAKLGVRRDTRKCSRLGFSFESDRMHGSAPALQSEADDQAVVFIRGVLEDHAFTGCPLWPLVPSILLAAFLAGETGDARVVISDSSPGTPPCTAEAW